MFVVGALSSVINSVGTNIAFGDDLKVMIAYWVGDVGGLFAALVILMFLFRALRKFANS